MSPNDSMTVVEAVKKAQELADELQSEQTSLKLFRCNHLLDILLPLIAHAKSAPKEQIDIPMLKGLVADAIINYNSTKRIDGASIRDLSCFIVNYLVAAKALLTASLPTEPTFTAGEVDAKLSSVPCFSGCHIKFPLHSRTCGDCYVYQIRQQSSKIRTILGGQ